MDAKETTEQLLERMEGFAENAYANLNECRCKECLIWLEKTPTFRHLADIKALRERLRGLNLDWLDAQQEEWSRSTHHADD